MSIYNRVFNAPEDDIIEKGVLDMYVPGTVNQGIGAAIVNKSGTGKSAYVLVFERISGTIPLGEEDMDLIPTNNGKASLRIYAPKTKNVCTLIGNTQFIEKIYGVYEQVRKG